MTTASMDRQIEIAIRMLADGHDESDFIHALGIAAKAKGMTEVAKMAGVTRASLYKSLSEDGNPGFETVSRIVSALGCRIGVM